MFNYKKFLRTVPARVLREYLGERQFLIPHDFDWSAPEDACVKALAAVIDGGDLEWRSALISDLQEAADLADEAGYRAILNACPAYASLVPVLKDMETFEQRALWIFWKHPEVFDKAQEIRFFDDNAIKQETKRTKLNGALPMSLVASDIQALANAVAAFYRQHEGSGDHCEIEIVHRHLEGSVQLTLYIEGLANNRPEFETGKLRRRRSHPAMELALVYNDTTTIVETAVRGGKKYHERLLNGFIRCLLKTVVRPQALRPQTFKLVNLKRGVTVSDGLKYGIQRVRLKKLVLLALDGSGGTLTFNAPAKDITQSAEMLAARWFQERDPLKGLFVIVQATIAIHFIPPTQGRKRRPLYIEFRRNSTIKWDKIDERERAMVEAFLVEWDLVEAPVASEPVVA